MYIIINGSHEVVDAADSHQEAMNIVTYLSSHEPANGPYHCAPSSLVVA